MFLCCVAYLCCVACLCCVALRLSMWGLLEGMGYSFAPGRTGILTPFRLSVQAGQGVVKPSRESRLEKQTRNLRRLRPLGKGKVWSRRFETAEIPEAGIIAAGRRPKPPGEGLEGTRAWGSECRGHCPHTTPRENASPGLWSVNHSGLANCSQAPAEFYARKTFHAY